MITLLEDLGECEEMWKAILAHVENSITFHVETGLSRTFRSYWCWTVKAWIEEDNL